MSTLKESRALLAAAVATGLFWLLLIWTGRFPTTTLGGTLVGLCLVVNFLGSLMGASMAARGLEMGILAKYTALLVCLLPLFNVLGAAFLLFKVQNALATTADADSAPGPNDFALGDEDLSPMGAVPSLTTLNGIGFKLYGRSDVDPRTESYMTTHYLVVLFFPVLPIARYRVISQGSRYQFLGKGRLRRIDKAHLAIVAALVVYAIKNAGLK